MGALRSQTSTQILGQTHHRLPVLPLPDYGSTRHGATVMYSRTSVSGMFTRSLPSSPLIIVLRKKESTRHAVVALAKKIPQVLRVENLALCLPIGDISIYCRILCAGWPCVKVEQLQEFRDHFVAHEVISQHLSRLKLK